MNGQVWRILGVALAGAAGVYFIVFAYRALEGHDLRRLLETEVLLCSVLLTFAYASLVPITALAWTWLLRGFGQPASVGLAMAVLASTQFGKYLPGNVAQHFGRVLVARSFGMRISPIVLSMSYETILVAAACAHVSVLSLMWAPPAELQSWPLFRYQLPAIALVTFGAVIALAMLPPVARWVALRRSPQAAPADARPGWATTAACYVIYLLNFVLIGAALWVTAQAVVPGDNILPGASFFIAAFASSWILGFLAPGAPAGLGVRETALTLWLEPALGAAASVLLIVLLRIATTLGDLSNFAWGSACLARRRSKS